MEKVKIARKERRGCKHSVFLIFFDLKSSMNLPLPLSGQNVKLLLLRNGDGKKIKIKK